MLRRHNQNEREAALRKYFEPPPAKPDGTQEILLMVGGGVLALLGLIFLMSNRSAGGGGCSSLLLVLGVVASLAGFLRWRSMESRYQKALEALLPQPTDEQVDQWLAESLQHLVLHSRHALRLDEAEGSFSTPLTLSAPTLDKTHGIPASDLKWKKGQEGRLRFSVYNIIIVYLTDRHLAAFTCDFNFIRDVSLNDNTREYHYQDVISVATYEWSESFHEPTRKKRVTAQIFRLSVASGEYIEVKVDCNLLRQMTKEEEVPAMGAEEKVATIRAMLREKKA